MTSITETLDSLPESLHDKVSLARRVLRCTRLGVAYSGGVDSAVLLALAVAELGAESVRAIIGMSPSLARDEHEAALTVAAQIGAQVVEIATHELDSDSYRANGPDRCYFCKDELFTRMESAARNLNIDALAYGENADDARRRDRPGSLAATEHRILRPLAAAGMTKEDVRAVAHSLDLQCADKPAAPCLASRIPHFSEVLPQKLAAVESSERLVRDLGFTDCRVRHHGEVARVELVPQELPRALEPVVRELLLTGIRRAGFRHVTIDLAGIQSGAFTLSLIEESTR